MANTIRHYSGLLRIVGWTALGLVAGSLVSGTICFFQPKRYVSRAGFEGQEPAGRKVELAPIHAVRIARALELENRWSLSRDETVAAVRAAVVIKALPGGTAILATHTNKEDARDIADEAAKYFRSMDAEAELAAKSPAGGVLSDKQTEAAEQCEAFALYLTKQVQSVGGWNFREIPYAAAKGSKEAAGLWENEDFQSHWKDYDRMSAGLDGWAAGGTPPAMARMIEPPVIAAAPSSPNVDRYLGIGKICGLLVGCVVGVRREAKRLPEADQPVPAVADGDPEDGFGNDDLPAAPPPSPRRAVQGSAEDEW